ncbi:uncharacterized protein LOC124952003 isoform X2 [Vespa velutina]|uniref:uncharacterized protein LOC124952003 isoform X2 n=1 Tax=Vespa velutina TaxID=202808 RepID=UPI001FB1D62E|nr:uncharacterized protein LOC124952003 isoform X2 [Vespa velutina]XP_047357173.1 uncharacterized protein LOC124952003 isoform X2 [Vespa velutina]
MGRFIGRNVRGNYRRSIIYREAFAFLIRGRTARGIRLGNVQTRTSLCSPQYDASSRILLSRTFYHPGTDVFIGSSIFRFSPIFFGIKSQVIWLSRGFLVRTRYLYKVAVYRTAEGCERIIWVNTKRAEQIRRNHEHVARREAGVEPAVHKEILRECDDAGGSTRKSRRSRGSSENSMYAYRSGHDVVRIHKQHIRAGPYSGVLAGHGYAAAIRIAGRTSTSK